MRLVDVDAALQTDIDRVMSLWGDSLACHADKGPWLLREFTIADAMFAPVVMRFRSYRVEIPGDIQPYCKHLLADPDVQAWLDLALQESWVVEADEAGTELPGA